MYTYIYVCCVDFLNLWEVVDMYTRKCYPKRKELGWFPYSLIKILKERNKCHKKFKMYGNPRDYDIY